MLRLLPFALLLAGCVSANSTKADKSGSPSVATDSTRLQTQVEALRTENQQLRKQIEELRFRMAQYREMPADQADLSLVLEVVNEFLLLPKEVYDQVGLDNWVYLRRGNQYVGRARILQISAKGTTARFDPEFPGPATPPRVGDVVVSLAVR